MAPTHMTTPTPSPPRGRFIVLEGIDGSGKTTQLDELAAWLPTSGLMLPGAELITTRAPGGTNLGWWLRELLLLRRGNVAPCATAELLLFAADTAQLVAEIIGPALTAGHWVLCDRYIGSTMAYQGYGRGHSLEVIQQLNQLATSGLAPDLTLWLDLPLAEALRRRSHRSADRIEAAGEAFLDRVIDGYQIQFVDHCPRWRCIFVGGLSVQTVARACQRVVADVFAADATP